ncbi:MAG TPA: tetratricopeptide repeat protein [Xanthobacteraceae bacterium]|nr:tetratricopeptide repeat protein [Xanthobacteraceae bacterium]
MLARAMFALDDERPGDAERMAAEVLRADPRHTTALYILGCALVMQDRAEDAIAPLEAAADGRDDQAIDTMLAIALRQVGRYEDAVSRLQRATGRHPPYAAAFTEFGHLLVLMDNYEAAIDVLNRGLEIAPKTPQLSIQLGFAHLSRGDCANAKTGFARALDISPDSHDALFGMAKAHQELGENEEAAGYFRRYLASCPDDSGAWLSFGHCLLELGQLDAGYDCFRVAAGGDAEHYFNALASLASSGRGRFWLRPSDAQRFFRTPRSED